MAMPRHSLSRRTLLAWSAGGGAALLLPAPGRAESLPDGDLAYLRLLIGTELLAVDFYTRALAARRKLGSMTATFRQLLAQERSHYVKLARLLTDDGQEPATSADVDFRYPAGRFASFKAIAALGWKIENLLVGAYLGAIESVATPELRLPIGQIAASEAHHLAVLGPAAKHSALGKAFPEALSMSAASNTLDLYES
jgi:rubrerythrin